MLNNLAIFGITLAVFLVVIVAMAVGVLFGRRQISGSCGGLANQTDADGQSSCSLCSNPDAACRELSARRQNHRRIEARRTAASTSPGWIASWTVRPKAAVRKKSTPAKAQGAQRYTLEHRHPTADPFATREISCDNRLGKS